jgi:hypothetical protein
MLACLFLIYFLKNYFFIFDWLDDPFYLFVIWTLLHVNSSGFKIMIDITIPIVSSVIYKANEKINIVSGQT